MLPRAQDAGAERRVSVRLARTDRAPASARRAVQQLVDEHSAAAAHLPMLTLLVSEIVTNAVIHPQLEPDSEIELVIVVQRSSTRILVSDEGPGFSASDSQPSGRGVAGGYGLRLLEAGSSRWGTSAADGRFAVWFEIDHAESLPSSA